MSKKHRINSLRECKNYATPCGIANNCNNCKNRVMGYTTDKTTNISKFGVKGCHKGLDIFNNEHKKDCFECAEEGTLRCKQD